MNSLKNTFILFAAAFTAIAQASPTDDFCKNALDAESQLNYVWFQDVRGGDTRYDIGFANDGGLLDQGVCWWHSEWSRNAIYLAVLDPSLPKPDAAGAKQIIKDLMGARKVVTIGGFSSVAEFTLEWQELLQKTLNQRQLRTTFDFGWIRGLIGHSEENPEKLEIRMDQLFTEVSEQHKIAYQMLQLPGIDAHSWLVTGMSRTSDGYQLRVVDSNEPMKIETMDYHRGSRSEGELDGLQYIAYTQQDKRFNTYENKIREFCQQ